MEEKREQNRLKHYAVLLAFQMDDEKRLYNENLTPWKEEEIRETGKQLRDEIWKKGYANQIETILFYADQYKTLSMAEYRNWIYE